MTDHGVWILGGTEIGFGIKIQNPWMMMVLGSIPHSRVKIGFKTHMRILYLGPVL